MEEKKWYDNLLLIADFIPPNPDEFDRFDVEKQVEDIAGLRFNTQHVEVSDVTVGEAGLLYFKSGSTFSESKRRDLLAEYCADYANHNINGIVYFNVHWLAEELCALRPDWYQRNGSGEKILIGYGSGGVTCVNSTFREWAFQVLKDLGRYSIKGVFLDGPFCHPDGCYCEACLFKFEGLYGFRYTPENVKDRNVYKTVIDFKKQTVEDFTRDAREALKSTNPEAIIYINGIQLGPDVDGRDNNRTVKWQDALLAEGGFLYTDLRSWPIWKPAATAKLLESQADGKPYIVAIAGRLGPWSRYLLPAAEKWIASAETIANGGNIWYGIYDSNRQDGRMKTVKEINAFLSSNAGCFSGTASAAKIALVWSFRNADFYQTTTDFVDFTGDNSTLKSLKKSDARRAFNGWYELLQRSHRVFDIIDEYYLVNKDLSRYELLVLPGIACMSEVEAERIKAFVEKGGSVITTFDTSCYDDSGVLRDDILLKNVLGVEMVEGVENLPGDHVEVEKSLYTEEVDQSLFPAPHLYLRVKPVPGAQPDMYFREKQPSRYCDLPSKTDYPFMVTNRFGRGKTIMFTGNIDVAYDSYRLPEHFKIMENVVDSLNLREIVIDGEITSLDVNIRRKDDKYIIHLINFSSFGGRPITKVVPLRDVKISIRMGNRPKSVRTLRSGKILGFDYIDGYLTVVVPEINEYEVVLCE